jgi:hypothetical protein
LKRTPAEAIFWDVSIQDVVAMPAANVWTHYMRIKIFTTLGVEQQSKSTFRI